MAKVSGQRRIYEMINSRIFALLEKGEIPWRKPWASGNPVNFITRKPYRGINPFILISSGFSCPYWVFLRPTRPHGFVPGWRKRGGFFPRRLIGVFMMGPMYFSTLLK